MEPKRFLFLIVQDHFSNPLVIKFIFLSFGEILVSITQPVVTSTDHGLECPSSLFVIRRVLIKGSSVIHFLT